MKEKVAIIDYEMGNVFSVEKMIRRLGYQVVVTSEKNVIESSDKLILPGVGHFGKAMDKLGELKLLDVLHDCAHVSKKPVLGICLGMQLLAQKSEEGNMPGLGWLNGEIVKFNISDKSRYKVPHTGWNSVQFKKESRLMKHINTDAEFYFVHSFYFTNGSAQDILTETVYEDRFVSSVEKDNIFGVQFHPEKSHDAGMQLIKNFIDL